MDKPPKNGVWIVVFLVFLTEVDLTWDIFKSLTTLHQKNIKFDNPPSGGGIWTLKDGQIFWAPQNPHLGGTRGSKLSPYIHWSEYTPCYLGPYGYSRMTPLGVHWGPWGAPTMGTTKLEIRPPGGPWGSFFEKLGSKRGPNLRYFPHIEFNGTNAERSQITSILNEKNKKSRVCPLKVSRGAYI